jgi:hypothetical protein
MSRSRVPALALAAALTFYSSTLQARSLVIESFSADIAVDPDGSVHVVETIRPRFTGTWNGIYRTIPIQYSTPQGLNYTLFLDVQSVTDGNGAPLKYESSIDRHYRKLKIWVPNATDGVRTVILRYEVENGLKFFEEHDELYWNVTGDEWDVPIESAIARVQLPAGAANVRAAAFTGGYGSRENAARITVGADDVRVETLHQLNFREGLTAVVGWDPGVVNRPGAMRKALWVLRSNLPLGVPILTFIGMWYLWDRRGRDPGQLPVAAAYEPPEGLTPAEVGTLIDNSPDMRDITATIVDLAVRGYLSIEEVEQDLLLGLWSNTDYVFTLQKPWAEWVGLAPHERKLLAGMFRTQEGGGGGEQSTVRLSELKNRFYKNLPGVRESIFGKLMERGFYTSRPDKVRTFYLVAAAVAGALVGYGGATIGGWFGIQPGSSILAGVLTGIVIAGFGLIMPARTVRGARMLESSLGFEEFLSRVESDRFARIVKTPAMFEKFLPYAMALGVEQNWARAFEGICKEPPAWYSGPHPHGFRASSFTGNLGRMSTQAAAVMASAPRGSGGSGFRGGSSGGGFGGGGGGGF